MDRDPCLRKLNWSDANSSVCFQRLADPLGIALDSTQAAARAVQWHDPAPLFGKICPRPVPHAGADRIPQLPLPSGGPSAASSSCFPGEFARVQRDLAGLVVEFEMNASYQPARQHRRFVVVLRVWHHRPHDHKALASITEENRFDVIDNGSLIPPLDAMIGGCCQVISQIIVSEFLIATVDDVSTVGVLPLYPVRR